MAKGRWGGGTIRKKYINKGHINSVTVEFVDCCSLNNSIEQPQPEEKKLQRKMINIVWVTLSIRYIHTN